MGCDCAGSGAERGGGRGRLERREGLVSETLSHPGEMLAGELQDRWVGDYARVCREFSVCA